MITFNDPQLSIEEIDIFALQYGLKLEYTPLSNLPNDVSWAYSFSIEKPRSKDMTSIVLAQMINEQEISLVKYADPNTFSVQDLSCDPITELTNFPNNLNDSWYIQNDGGIIKNGKSGLNDADADICECWAAGATGTGVRIGVIDHGAFQFSHPDFAGSNIPYVFDATNQSIKTVDFFYDSTEVTSHSMNVTGLIAATK